jgi:peptidoglycan/xylan/chitin deacetylase (PgdA/CDA1 family)
MFGLNRLISGILGSRGGSVVARKLPGRTFNALHGWPRGLESQNSSVFVLSFDCETDRDINSLEKLLQQLDDAGVLASFAVIGELAERFPSEHQAIVSAGHEIVNHGYSEHTSIADDGTYTSTFLYNDLSQQQMLEEITKGSKVIEDVCGVIPVGFRAPHFGTLRVATGEVEQLHKAISESGAQYSSSMSDLEALRLGYSGDDIELLEFPLASHPNRPAAVLDSWSTVAAYGDSFVTGSLYRPLEQLLSLLNGSKSSRFASVYFDPAQVVDLPEFIDFLNLLRAASSELLVLRYSDLIPKPSTGYFMEPRPSTC